MPLKGRAASGKNGTVSATFLKSCFQDLFPSVAGGKLAKITALRQRLGTEDPTSFFSFWKNERGIMGTREAFLKLVRASMKISPQCLLRVCVCAGAGGGGGKWGGCICVSVCVEACEFS